MTTQIQANLIDDLMVERFRQDEEFGKDRHLADHVWLEILMEEVGEVSQALLHDVFGGKAKGTKRKELVQVTAVAFAWLEDIDRTAEIGEDIILNGWISVNTPPDEYGKYTVGRFMNGDQWTEMHQYWEYHETDGDSWSKGGLFKVQYWRPIADPPVLLKSEED